MILSCLWILCFVELPVLSQESSSDLQVVASLPDSIAGFSRSVREGVLGDLQLDDDSCLDLSLPIGQVLHRT